MSGLPLIIVALPFNRYSCPLQYNQFLRLWHKPYTVLHHSDPDISGSSEERALCSYSRFTKPSHSNPFFLQKVRRTKPQNCLLPQLLHMLQKLIAAVIWLVMKMNSNTIIAQYSALHTFAFGLRPSLYLRLVVTASHLSSIEDRENESAPENMIYMLFFEESWHYIEEGREEKELKQIIGQYSFRELKMTIYP